MNKYLLLIFVALGAGNAAHSQENSPLSRYGMGDIMPNQNMVSRGMGGIAAGLADTLNGRIPNLIKNSFGINFVNPASLSNVTYTTFDLGVDVDIRTLKSFNPAKKFTSVNTIFSYLQLAFPLSSSKMLKKDINWGMSIGVRPVTKINYKIEENKRLTNIDSLNTNYEGDGGVNQAFIGTGIKFKNFSIGANFGYTFGSKQYNTKLNLINDSVEYYRSNTAQKTTFGGIFLSAGIQYDIDLKNNGHLRLGAYGSLQQNLKATRDDVIETFTIDGSGTIYRIDSIYSDNNKGTIKYPTNFGVGFTYQDNHWLFGADFEATSWSQYKYYGATDNSIQNSWVIRVGGQYFPAKFNTPAKKYFSFVKYRAGFYYGPDYIKLSDSRPAYGVTVGGSFPLTSLKRLGDFNYYPNQSLVMLNTALEVGNRGNKTSGLKENIVRFSVGISMNARWFIKPKYN